VERGICPIAALNVTDYIYSHYAIILVFPTTDDIVIIIDSRRKFKFKIGPHLRELWGIMCVPGFFLRRSVQWQIESLGVASLHVEAQCTMHLLAVSDIHGLQLWRLKPTSSRVSPGIFNAVNLLFAAAARQGNNAKPATIVKQTELQRRRRRRRRAPRPSPGLGSSFRWWILGGSVSQQYQKYAALSQRRCNIHNQCSDVIAAEYVTYNPLPGVMTPGRPSQRFCMWEAGRRLSRVQTFGCVAHAE